MWPRHCMAPHPGPMPASAFQSPNALARWQGTLHWCCQVQGILSGPCRHPVMWSPGQQSVQPHARLACPVPMAGRRHGARALPIM